jgi:hypothetical protein
LTNKVTCQRLDDDGRQCRNQAIAFIKYHGDHEVVYGTRLTWVKVAVCKPCLEDSVWDDNYETIKEKSNT